MTTVGLEAASEATLLVLAILLDDPPQYSNFLLVLGCFFFVPEGQHLLEPVSLAQFLPLTSLVPGVVNVDDFSENGEFKMTIILSETPGMI